MHRIGAENIDRVGSCPLMERKVPETIACPGLRIGGEVSRATVDETILKRRAERHVFRLSKHNLISTGRQR